MPEKLAQVAVFFIGDPDSGEAVLDQQFQKKLRILTICLLLSDPLCSDLSGIPDPQLEAKLCQQILEPTRVPQLLPCRPAL